MTQPMPLPLEHPLDPTSSYRRHPYHENDNLENRINLNSYRHYAGVAVSVTTINQSHERRRSPISNSKNTIVTLLVLLMSSTASIVATHGHTPLPNFIAPTFLASRYHHQLANHQYSAGRSACNNNRASLFVSIQHPSSGRVIGNVVGGGGGITKDIMSSFSHNHNGANKGGGVGASSPNNHNLDDAYPVSFQSTVLLQKLSSFSSNISRRRTARKKLSLVKSSNNEREHHDTEESTTTETAAIITATAAKGGKTSDDDDALIRACASLVYFLRDETVKLSSFSSSPFNQKSTLWDSTTVESVKEVFEMVLIQAIRASSEVGDFVLLPKIVVAAVEYAAVIAKITTTTTTPSTSTNLAESNTTTNNNNIITTAVAILSPRIFGESISSLSKTKASLSKIKSLWNYFMYDVVGLNTKSSKYPSILSSPPSSYELNSMLSTLKERGKVSAAIKLYRQVVCDGGNESNERDGELSSMKGDAYSASILFGMLAESISSSSASRGLNTNISGDDGTQEAVVADDRAKSANDTDGRPEADYVSPCWQWNEAMELLELFDPSQLNNFAYTALLTVNDRATQVYTSTSNADLKPRRRRHDGVRCALLVLEKMKVCYS